MSDSFIRERMLWRARKHRLLERRCVLFPDAPAWQSATVKEVLGEDIDGVLLFWESNERWTLLAETFVASWHHDKLHRCDLGSIDKQISIPSLKPDSGPGTKQAAEYIALEKSGQLIWAPNGSELFALMNVLLMFPLRGNASRRGGGVEDDGTRSMSG